MAQEIPELANVVAETLGQLSPLFAAAAGGTAASFFHHVTERSGQAAADASANWFRRSVLGLFGRRVDDRSGDSDDITAAGTVVPVTVVDLLRRLAVDPADPTARQDLVGRIVDAVGVDPGLETALRELASTAPTREPGPEEREHTGPIIQIGTSGITVSSTGHMGNLWIERPAP